MMPTVERILIQLLGSLQREVLVGLENWEWGEETNGGLRLGRLWESIRGHAQNLLK